MTLFTLPSSRIVSGPIAPLLAVCVAAAASAQVAPPTTQATTSSDGLLTLVLSSTNPSDTTGIDNTYTWTASNNSTTTTLTGVTLGSHWGDWCGGTNCTPPGPTLISAPGCANQGVDEIPPDAHFGVWCTPLTGVTLLPGERVSGSVALRPGSGGPPDYTVYSFYNDPKTGTPINAAFVPMIRHSNVVAPADRHPDHGIREQWRSARGVNLYLHVSDQERGALGHIWRGHFHRHAARLTHVCRRFRVAAFSSVSVRMRRAGADRDVSPQRDAEWWRLGSGNDYTDRHRIQHSAANREYSFSPHGSSADGLECSE